MPRRFFSRVVVLAALVAVAACAAPRPVLYPNERLQEAGQDAAQRDIDDCLRQAAAAGASSSSAGREVAGSTAIGAATGAAVGAATGAVWGSAGRGAAAGAAGGGAAGLIRGLFRGSDLDPVQKRFVEECLRQKGYQPIGWK